MWLVVLGGLVLLALYKLLYNSNVNSEDTDKSENSIPDLSQNLESIPESPDLTRARSFISGIIASKMKQESAYTPEILDVSQIEQDIVCDKPEISCKVQEISSSEPIVSKIAETVVPKSEISDDIACKVHEVIASEKIVSKIAETVVPKSEISDDIACNVQDFISNQPIVSKIAKTVESVMPKSEISEEVQYIIDPVVSKTTEMVESPQSEFFENFACKVTRPIETTVVAIAENVQSASPKSEISDDNICKIQESIPTEPIIAKVAETLESFETENSDDDVDTTEDIIITEIVESVIPKTEISPNKISSVHFSEPLVTKTTEILVSLSPETEISDDFTSGVTTSTEPETFISVTKEMISDKIQEIIIDEPIITETVNISSQEISNATNVQSSDPTIPESESLIFNESNVPRDTPTNDVITHEITAKSETKNDIEPEVGQTIICTSQTVHESPAADTEIISPEITVHETDLKNDIAAEIEQVIISDSPKNQDKTEETISTEVALEEAIVCESPKIQDKIEETFSMEMTVPVNDAEIEKEISLEPPKIQDKVEETISMEKTVTGEQAIVCESPRIREKIEETIFTEMTVPKNDTEAKVKQAVNLESPKIEEMIFTEMTVPKKFAEAKVEQAVNLESPKIQDKIEEAIFTDTTIPLTPKIEDKVEEDIFTEITVPTTPKIDDKCDITNQAEIKKVISTAHDLSESSDDSISMEVTVPKSTEDKIAITLESECKEEIFDLNQFERQISTASSVPQIPEPSKDIQTTDLDEPISEEQTICNVEPGKESSFVNCSESLSEIENTLKRLESCITHNIEEIVEVEHKPSPKIVKIVPAEVPEVDNDSLMEEFESNDAEIDIPAPQIHPSDMLPKSPEIAEILAALDDPPETLIIEDIKKTSPETTTEVPEPTMKTDSSHSETEVPKHTKIVVNKQFENECKIPEPSSSIPEPTKLFETFVDNQRTVTECTIPETDINCNPETESRSADPETFSKTSAQASEKAAKQLDELLEELNLAPHIVTKGNTDAASLNELATGDEIVRGTLEIIKNGVKTSLESVPSTSETLDEITLILVPETSEIEQDESSTEESVHCDIRDVPLSPNEEISVVEIVEKFNIPVVAVESNKKSFETSVESSEKPTEVAHSVESHEISVESNEKSSEILVGGNSKSLEISVESNEKAPKVEASKVEVPVDSLESSIKSQAALLKAIDLEDTRTKTDENRTISGKNENGINVTEVANEVNSIIDEAAARVEANANIMGQIKPEPLQTSASMPGSTGGILAEKLEQLDKAAQDWKKRIGPNDAIEFSVAGRMGISTPPISPSPVHLAADRKKKTPKPARFRSRIAGKTANRSAPGSPQKGDSPQHPLLRSISAPDGRGAATVEVPSPHDESFAKFFAPSTLVTSAEVTADVDIADFEELTQHTLLVQHKRTVKMQRRRLGSRNPVKALAARTDLLQEYQEVRTGAAEREMKRLNVEKLAKNSNLAVEALAGLASKEDFTAVALKKATSGPTSQLLPYQDLMLLQVKGRRHVQTRLVQPVAASVNLGDSYVLVTPSAVYNWLGRLSNVIERTRSAEVAQQISQRKELGCSKAGGNVHTIDEGKIAAGSSVHRRAFWRILGVEDGNGEAAEAGHPDEDENFEASVTDTNMIYTVEEDELVPVERYWGCIPRIEMLDPAKVIVFDFGAELYIWSGKNASPEARKSGVNLARELWESGVDYSECDLSPVGEVSGARPSWALLGKLSQHMESALFREKFLDWPEFTRLIRVKDGDTDDKQVDASIEVLPLDVKEMLASEWTEPDLELEGSHLGRGDSYFDPETHRVFEVTTSAITVWHVEEFGCHQVPPESLGHFHCEDSFVVRWNYSITVTGRELSGAPSKHAMTGRSRCAYFFWQGSGASVSDQGAAALLTVELDREQGPHVRVEQGAEPSAFLRLFDGHMVTHAGHREEDHPERWRLYLVRSGGSHSAETSLVQVPCSTRQLRSRTSLLLLDIQSGHLWAWHGAQSHPTCRTAALEAASWLRDHTPLEFGLSEEIELKVTEVKEGHENEQFFTGLGGSSRQLYSSLPLCKSLPRLRMFHLSSACGSFVATEILSPARTKEPPLAFPFRQSDLYVASQPALFLLDAGTELWLWQGWWAEEGGEESAGSGAVRWQAERRAAMQTVLDYWQHTRKGEMKAYLVWAGLEPLAFTNLFPQWTDRDDAAECNIQDGHKAGEVLDLDTELARLTRSTYPPAQLLQRPLPDGVDPTRLEDYLAPTHFQELLGMTKEEYLELPSWKQTNVKKYAGLF